MLGFLKLSLRLKIILLLGKTYKIFVIYSVHKNDAAFSRLFLTKINNSIKLRLYLMDAMGFLFNG